jgi:hypothetical protein
MTQEEFNKWTNEACRYYHDKAISGEVDLAFYAFQSEPLIDKEVELLILKPAPYGNDSYGDTKYEDSLSNFSKSNKVYDPKWSFRERLHHVFKAGKIQYMLDEDYPHMIMNLVCFNVVDIKTFKKKYDRRGVVFNECADLTYKFIQLLKPKRIVCLSIFDCFERLKNRFTDYRILIPSNLIIGKWGDIPVYGIKHPSAHAQSGSPVAGRALKYLFERDQHQGVSIEEFKQLFHDDIRKVMDHRKFKFNPEQQSEIASETIDLLKKRFGLTVHPEKDNSLYISNKQLYITIAKTGSGYVTIRHSNFGCGKSYKTGKFKKQEELSNLLLKYGYAKNKLWLGEKFFLQYSFCDYDVPQAIADELEKLMPQFDEILM